jgi:hypothetical protein
MAQESDETRFVKIKHTADRTVAFDSSGDKWIYDSELGEFVHEDDYEGGGGDDSDIGPDAVILPPEIRCTDIHKGDITEVFSRVVVEIDERIEGSVTSGKDIIIKGLVTGNVLSYRTVTVESTGEVRGDVIAREIISERGGRIIGQRTEVTLPGGIGVPEVGGVFPDFMGVIFTGFLIFLCIIVIALLPKQVHRVVTRITTETLKSFLVGLLAWFAILPLFVLLVITIVGIPIALLIFPFALIAAFLLGYVGITIYIGNKFCPVFGWQDKSIYIKSICGVIFIAIIRLLANFLATIGLEGLALFIAIVYMVLAFVAVSTGLGAVVTTRFGTRERHAGITPDDGPHRHEPQPAPPVKPPPPPQTEPLPPQVTPPPPVPPPPPKSGNATDEQ